MSGVARWDDLAPRVISGLVMIVVGIAAIWAGGLVFRLFVWALGGVMVWETARMFGARPGQAVQLALLGMAALIAASFVPALLVVPVLLAAALVGSVLVRRDNRFCGVFTGWVLVAGFSVLMLREQAGLVWMVWLISVVVVSDVAGYFAGRMLGGPKFWPRISPKKTWSGTVAGWFGAGIVGIVFAAPAGAGWALVPLSALAALAGQLGDILESAVKRRAGVKDSSALIPGHGGVLDRFDAVLGAAMLAMVLWFLNLLPGPA